MSQSERTVRKVKYSMEFAEFVCRTAEALGDLLLYIGSEKLIQGYEHNDPEAKKLGIKTIIEGRNMLMKVGFMDVAISKIKNNDGAEKWGSYLDLRIDNLIEGI